VILKLWDNGGRRSGLERRRFSYDGFIPERRGEDRRNGEERRCGVDRRSGKDRRSGESPLLTEAFAEKRVSSTRRERSDRRAAASG
jgi:hypothetical protein